MRRLVPGELRIVSRVYLSNDFTRLATKLGDDENPVQLQILSPPLARTSPLGHIPIMLNIDLSGRRALVAGVADDGGFGFAIAKALAEAGASVSVGTWPPALNIFMNLIERGKMDESRKLSNGELLQFEKIYPLDAAFDTLNDAPQDIRDNKRYKDTGDFSIDGLVSRVRQDFGEKGLDHVLHSLANGTERK